jgi:hypothetical protein
VEDIAREYIEAFWELYDPKKFLDRVYRHFLILGAPKNPVRRRKVDWIAIRALLILAWRQGVVRETRWKFWINLLNILRYNPGVWDHYLTICAYFEHFYEYRQLVRDRIQAQLNEFLANEAAIEALEREAENNESAVA